MIQNKLKILLLLLFFQNSYSLDTQAIINMLFSSITDCIYNYTHNNTIMHFNSLKEVEEVILALEKESRDKLQKTFNIPDDVWNTTIQEAETVHQALLKHLKSEQNHIHDTILPDYFLTLVTECLQRFDINPKAISIINTTESEIYARVKISKFTILNNTVLFSGLNTMEFNFKNMKNQNNKEVYIAAIIHEIGHLLAGHGIYSGYILKTISQHTTLDIKAITEHPDFIAYDKMQERTADLLVSIREPYYAQYVHLYTQKLYMRNRERNTQRYPTPQELYPWNKAIVALAQKELSHKNNKS